MTMFSKAVGAQVAEQSPAALGTVLANIVVDRPTFEAESLRKALRDGWTSSDATTDPVLMAAFDYDRTFTGLDQTILIHTNPAYDFTLVTAELSGEPDIECMVAGKGFALVTRDLFRAGWCAWSECPASTVPLADVLSAIGR